MPYIFIIPLAWFTTVVIFRKYLKQEVKDLSTNSEPRLYTHTRGYNRNLVSVPV